MKKKKTITPVKGKTKRKLKAPVHAIVTGIAKAIASLPIATVILPACPNCGEVPPAPRDCPSCGHLL